MVLQGFVHRRQLAQELVQFLLRGIRLAAHGRRPGPPSLVSRNRYRFMLQQGRYRERLNSLLEIRDKIVEDPESHVAQHDAILAQIEIPQALLVLPGRVLDLERLVAGILLHIMQQTQSIAQPEHP